MEEVGSTMIDLNRIVGLVKENKAESWKEIDRLLPRYANQQEFFDWAKGNTRNPVFGLRDLAASVFEQTDLKLDDAIVENLFELMEEVDEENPYPSFRGACALAKRHEDKRVVGRIDEIRSKLQNFVEDEDVSEIARDYLQEIG